VSASIGESLSRRDRTIVAWHEVPGQRHPNKEPSRRDGVIRAGVRARSVNGVMKIANTKTDYLSLKKHGAHFNVKYFVD
jgi:hypothetical protein